MKGIKNDHDLSRMLQDQDIPFEEDDIYTYIEVHHIYNMCFHYMAFHHPYCDVIKQNQSEVGNIDFEI